MINYWGHLFCAVSQQLETLRWFRVAAEIVVPDSALAMESIEQPIFNPYGSGKTSSTCRTWVWLFTEMEPPRPLSFTADIIYVRLPPQFYCRYVREMELTTLQWSTLRSGNQMIDCKILLFVRRLLELYLLPLLTLFIGIASVSF